MSEKFETENFEQLLEESLAGMKSFEGTVVKGKVVVIENGVAVIDVGLKSEGRVSLREFEASGEKELAPGDLVEVYVERFENREGEAVLSREKARREAAWEGLELSYKGNERVAGVITNRVKGGFTVDLSGAVAFLPGSQVDVRPIKDPTPLMGVEQPFMILKMDRLRGNIVVSRRAVMEESRSESRSELFETLGEGKVVEGIVKNITDYGAFIDLGGIDGLLHVTDISWQRINHPSDLLEVGQSVNVMVIKHHPDTHRISLGLKQLQENPWQDIGSRYPVNEIVKGKVTNVTDYGVFVELEPGIEGLIHVSELSWTKKNIHPNKIVSAGDEVDVRVLDVDAEKRRISLSLRQVESNPWDTLGERYKVGDIIEGEIKNIAEFGLFVGLEDDIDGMVHISDLSWEEEGDDAIKKYAKGDTVRAKLLEISPDKERIALGIKQLDADPFTKGLEGVESGSIITCIVSVVEENGIQVKTENDVFGYIRKSDLSRDRGEQKPERFAVGERVDAKVISFDKKSRKIILSIKARELQEERKAMEEYGSSDSGASLGDILGGAFDMEKMKESARKK